MLYVLKNAEGKLRNNILKVAEPDLIKALCDCTLNTLNGNVQIGSAVKRKLRKYKKEMRKISCTKRNITSKRKLILQHGGFVPTLLGALLSGVVGAYLKKQ